MPCHGTSERQGHSRRGSREPQGTFPLPSQVLRLSSFSLWECDDMKTVMKKLTLGLSVAALSIGGIAYAQQNAPAKPFMDADKDGVITRAEAKTAAEAMFAKLDVNKAGKIDQADRDARHAERRSEMTIGRAHV